MSTLSSITVAPIRSAHGRVVLPGSKSSSIRALLMAAHAPGETLLGNLLDSDDGRVMQRALATLGFAMQASDGDLVVQGASSAPVKDAQLFVGNSGLSIRTLLPVLAAAGGDYRLQGVARMHQRPIGDLVSALLSIGAAIDYLAEPGFPPLQIKPAPLHIDGPIRVDGSASSQFLTGLLQAAPLWDVDHDIVIEIEGQLISRPYVGLTIDLMRRFGVEVDGDVEALAPSFRVAHGARYQSPGRFDVEGDASSASYFLALGALTGGSVEVAGLRSDSVQPDARLTEVLTQMGASVTSGAGGLMASSPGLASGFRLNSIDLDLNHMPDAAMTVAVLCLFAKGRSVLRNIGSWRVKETDRLSAMACELRKFGAQIEEGPDWLAVTPPEHWSGAAVDTYEDHRMAMSLSLVACAGVPVEIRDPGCVAKTFPDYFEQLYALTQGP